MEENDFRRRVDLARRFLAEDLKSVRTVSSVRSLPINGDYNAVAFREDATYGEIYRAAVSLSYYNVMLDDYAVFQFSWHAETSWRLAYLPNPWISGAAGVQQNLSEWEALEALGALDSEELNNLIDELPYHGAIPPIRFEMAIHQYREIAHPAAHLHIGRHTSNRWALSRPLDPLTFSMAIMRLYYPSIWNPLSSFHGAYVESCVDKRFIFELKRCSRVHEFTDAERQSLHLHS